MEVIDIRENYEKDIYIICRHGNSSLKAVKLLRSYEKAKEENKIVSVKGGYLEWQESYDLCD